MSALSFSGLSLVLCASLCSGMSQTFEMNVIEKPKIHALHDESYKRYVENFLIKSIYPVLEKNELEDFIRSLMEVDYLEIVKEDMLTFLYHVRELAYERDVRNPENLVAVAETLHREFDEILKKLLRSISISNLTMDVLMPAMIFFISLIDYPLLYRILIPLGRDSFPREKFFPEGGFGLVSFYLVTLSGAATKAILYSQFFQVQNRQPSACDFSDDSDDDDLLEHILYCAYRKKNTP